MNIFDKLFVGDKSYFDIPVSEQTKYLESLGTAKDDFERSFKQYKGQVFFMSKTKFCLLSVLSLIVVCVLVLYYTARGLFVKKQYKVEAISRAGKDEQFIPNSLLIKYDVKRDLWNTKGAFYVKDIPFALLLFVKYIFHPYLLLKLLFKVAKYSSLIYKYQPGAVIVNDEFSFTSSIMTLFCERHNVKHINVQHGEKFYYIRDSFFRFHECYIWDEHYKRLFILLKAEPSQFIIELPESMKFDLKKHYSEQYYADFKYYLAIYNEEEIKAIVNVMEFIKRSGYTVKYRPHPNYSDVNLLKKYVSDDEIELPKVNILDSISSTKHVVGVFSTVLTQAFFNGQNVLIDDVSYKNQYNALKDLQYILIDKVEGRLSSYQV